MRAVISPGVVSLTYSVKSGDGVTYDAPPPVEFATDEADFRLADGMLTCRMKVHCSTVAQAQLVVQPVLDAWELNADLGCGCGELRFHYEDVDLVDRNPPVPGTAPGYILAADSADIVAAGADASFSVTRRTYPPPPSDFRITPDVESLWHRYRGHLEGREPLLTMAYFCLTVLEIAAGGKRDKRRKAAAKYRIEPAVLKKLSELSSDRGDPRIARKMPTPATPPLSGTEEAWIQAAIKQLILRVGDQRNVLDLPTMTMADLPRFRPFTTQPAADQMRPSSGPRFPRPLLRSVMLDTRHDLLLMTSAQ